MEDLLRFADCKMLEEFQLGSELCFTDEVLFKFLQLPRLKTLKLFHCPRLTSEGIKKAFLKKTSILNKLNLSYIYNLTCVAMRVILKACPELKKLMVDNCDLITDLSVRAIAEHCHLLESLKLFSLDLINSPAVEEIVPSLRKLREVSLDHLPNVSSEIPARLRAVSPHLTINALFLGVQDW